jgi:hypothetical protein
MVDSGGPLMGRESWADTEADRHFDGPVDKHGAPKIGDEPLDVEVRFTEKDGVFYRFYWESPTDAPFVGPWLTVRQQAYEQGKRWLLTGRL